MSAPVSSPALAAVARADTCSGCGLCAAVSDGAIRMVDRAPGWLRPEQTAPLTPEAEASIEAACPGRTIAPQSPAPIDDILWGPAIEVMTGHATNADLRHTASSGGAISALLTHALATGLIDFVVQTGADPARPLANLTAASTSATDIAAAAGSRYAPSAPLERLEHWLAQPGRFAFVGKPCDVAALRALAARDPRIAARVPLMLSFFCAGIPSHNAGQRILKRLGVDADDVTAFRYRGDGWPGYATARLRNGQSERMTYADSWGQILSKEVQFRCKICPDAVGGHADVVAADAWYGDDRGYPSFEEAEGRSLIMARTPAGLALLDAARAAGAIATSPLAATEIIRMQPHQARRKRQINARLKAMALAGRPVPRFAGNHLAEAAAQEPLLARLKAFAGLLRRFLQGRA